MKAWSQDKSNNIVLIGFMGTGKSTVGPELAHRLGWEFIDTDRVIEEHEGRTIPQIFEEKDEAYFRVKETEAIEIVMSGVKQVISTGGGAVLKEYNCQKLSESGYVIALMADADTIISRVKKDTNRPLLQGNLEQRVYQMLEERKHAYQFADKQIDTAQRTIEDLVGIILESRNSDLKL